MLKMRRKGVSYVNIRGDINTVVLILNAELVDGVVKALPLSRYMWEFRTWVLVKGR